MTASILPLQTLSTLVTPSTALLMSAMRVLMSAAALLAMAAPAAAQLPIPPMAAATSQASAYLFHAGAGDTYEVTSSIMAVQHAASPDLRAFASMMIADHTQTTNGALAAATSAGAAGLTFM